MQSDIFVVGFIAGMQVNTWYTWFIPGMVHTWLIPGMQGFHNGSYLVCKSISCCRIQDSTSAQQKVKHFLLKRFFRVCVLGASAVKPKNEEVPQPETRGSSTLQP